MLMYLPSSSVLYLPEMRTDKSGKKMYQTTEVKQSYEVKSTGKSEVVSVLNYQVENYVGLQRLPRI